MLYTMLGKKGRMEPLGPRSICNFDTVNASAATITHCPTNRVLIASTDCTAALPNLTVELESTNPDDVVDQSPLADTLLSLGTNLVTFTVTDTDSGTDTCTAFVTVIDDTAPTILVGATTSP